MSVDRAPDDVMRRRIESLTAWLERGEPHAVRGPFSRWPRSADAVVAAAAFATALISTALSELPDGASLTVDDVVDRPVGVYVLLAIGSTSLWWRRTRPIVVTAVVLASLVVWALAGYGDGADVALVVAMYSVGRHRQEQVAGLAVVASAVVVSLVGSIIDASQRIDVLPALLVAALPWFVGRQLRNRSEYLDLLRERAERLEAERHAEALQAVAAERSRIARELHDVVAHQVSMMTVQAGAAKTIAREDPDAAIDAMGDVERAGRQALGELRHLLGVLRRSTDAADDLGPQPGLADVSELVDELTQTGADVRSSTSNLPAHVSAAVDLSVYRIVQESCTNIVRHAGPNPVVELAINHDNERLVIDVTNSVSTVDRGQQMDGAAGHGIAGMRERAALFGGTLIAEPLPPGRFHVRAEIPLGPA